jgi:membrane protein YdbS with pleckstrin-like domain
VRLDDLIKAATSRVETVRVVRTAINPLLWLVGIVTPASLVLAVAVGETWIRAALFSLGALPVVVTIAAYFVLMFRGPDRLQSEEYRFRQRALQMLYRKGTSAEIVDAAREIVRIEKLPGGFGDGEKP